MKRALLYSVAALAIVASAEAQSPSRVRLCYMVGDVCTNVDDAHPLPTTAAAGGGGGGSSSSVSGGGGSGGGVLTPTGQATLAVITSSSQVALPNSDPVVILKNTGTTDARFTLGNGSATATAASYLISAGESIAVDTTGKTHVGAITATGSTTIELTQGTLETATTGGGGGGGGSVTQGTTPWVVAGNGTAGSAAVGVLTVQGIASMTPLLTTATQSGTWNVNAIQSGAWTAAVTGTVAATQSGVWTVTGAGGTFPATQSGSWTVQPGNTANTTAWLVTGTGGTFPATQSGAWNIGQTGTWTVQPGNTANTTAWLVTGTGGTFPATQSGNWSTRTQDGSGNAITSTLRGGERALTVQIVDGSGNQITSFGGSGGTASNFGSAFPSSGTAIGISDGTNMRAHLGAANALNSTGQSLATAQIIAQFDDTSPTAITENSFGNLRMSANRNFFTTLRDAAGNERGVNVTASNELNVACTTGCSGGSFNNNADGVATSATNGQAAAWGYTWNGATWDRQKSALNALNSTGAGIAAAQIVAQFDDATPTAITENQFGNLRMSTNRNLFGTLRDAAGNERGANVNAANELTVACTTGCSGGSFNNNADAVATSATNGQAAAWGYVWNGSTWDRQRGAVNATNSVGTGIAASAGLAQFDDTSPTAITENSFGNVRMSANRNQYMTIRDSAGNERGMNVNASGQASVSVDAGSVFNSNGQGTMANSSPVVIASDQSHIGIKSNAATGAAPPAQGNYIAGNASGATGGLLAGVKTCDLHASYDASDTGNLRIIVGVSGRKVYICGMIMATGGTATNLKLTGGTGTNCGTGTYNITPAYQLVANDRVGFMSSFWTGMVTTTNADDVCINASAANAHQAQVFYTIQ